MTLAFLLALPLLAQAPLAVPFIRQNENGCGAASVAMVLHYWKPQPGAAPAHADVYRALYQPGRNGIALADMKRYAAEAGFVSVTLRGEWSDIVTHTGKGRPLIVALQRKPSHPMHFAVVSGAAAEHVWLHDPTSNKVRRLPQTGFLKQWERAGRWMLLATPR